MDSPVHIQPEALDRLRDWGGEKLVGQMIRLFLENSAGRMDQIRAGVSGGNLDEAEKGAHSLKSSAANVGAEQVRAISAEIEQKSSQGDPSVLADLLGRLEEAYAEATSVLADIEKSVPE